MLHVDVGIRLNDINCSCMVVYHCGQNFNYSNCYH